MTTQNRKLYEQTKSKAITYAIDTLVSIKVNENTIQWTTLKILYVGLLLLKGNQRSL